MGILVVGQRFHQALPRHGLSLISVYPSLCQLRLSGSLTIKDILDFILQKGIRLILLWTVANLPFEILSQLLPSLVAFLIQRAQLGKSLSSRNSSFSTKKQVKTDPHVACLQFCVSQKPGRVIATYEALISLSIKWREVYYLCGGLLNYVFKVIVLDVEPERFLEFRKAQASALLHL